MPTYEYRCPKGHHFELFQRMSDEPRAVCPECGRESERLLSGGAGFLFKGEGFYATDYRSDSYKKEASKEKGAASDPAASSSGKDEAKGASSSSSSEKGSPAESAPSSDSTKGDGP